MSTSKLVCFSAMSFLKTSGCMNDRATCMFLTTNHTLHLLLIITLKQMIKIYQWWQHRVQKLTVNFNIEFENKLIILFKQETAISPLLISGSWERIELFREANSVSACLRHSQGPDHRTKWDLMILPKKKRILPQYALSFWRQSK